MGDKILERANNLVQGAMAFGKEGISDLKLMFNAVVCDNKQAQSLIGDKDFQTLQEADSIVQVLTKAQKILGQPTSCDNGHDAAPPTPMSQISLPSNARNT